MKRKKLALLGIFLIPMVITGAVTAQIWISMMGNIGWEQANSKIMWSSTGATGFADVQGQINGDQFTATMAYYPDVPVSIEYFVMIELKPAYAGEDLALIYSGENIDAGLCDFIRISAYLMGTAEPITVVLMLA